MSNSSQFRTESERLFAAYLDKAHYQWAYEVPIDGRSKIPDFQVSRGNAECLCDVKERAPKSAPPGARHFDPIKGIRKLIESGRQKFAEFDEYPCALILYNNGDCDTRLDPLCIFGAMLGEPGMQFAFDTSSATINADSATNVFLPRGGKMIKHYDPVEPHDSTKAISAVVALTTCRPPNPVYEKVVHAKCHSLEQERGRQLTTGERLSVQFDVLQLQPATLGEFLRLTVCLNPLATHALSDDLFNGPYDERWSMIDGTMTRIFEGESLHELPDQ